jgi:hypothetical protein
MARNQTGSICSPEMPRRTFMAAKALGYEEGRNVQLDWRNLADETAAHGTTTAFARDRADVIVAFESTVPAAMEATAYIPIVFINAADPVENGGEAPQDHAGSPRRFDWAGPGTHLETPRRGELDGVLAVSPYLTRRFFE